MVEHRTVEVVIRFRESMRESYSEREKERKKRERSVFCGRSTVVILCLGDMTGASIATHKLMVVVVVVAV